MKKIKKVSIKIGAFALGAMLLFPNFSFAASASFNTNSADYPTVRAANYTLYPNSTTNWSTYTTAEAGQIVGVAIYYHNTSSATAENTTIRVNRPSGTNNIFTITGSVGASNAVTVTGATTISIPSNETLTYVPGSVKWFPNQSLSEQTLPNGQDGTEIFGNGLNIGNIASGWNTQGSVVLQFQISKSTPPPQQSQPSVTTNSATNVGQNSATLNGYVNPNGSTDTTRWFEWGTSSGNLNFSTNHNNQGSSASNFSDSVAGLSANTTYYFRAVARNSAGTVYGSVLSFRTDSAPTQNKPAVSTNSASNVGETSATLNGYLATNQSTDTERWFEWGTSSTNLSRSTSHNGQSSDGAFSETISGLSADTTYYFRAAGENSAGVDYGSTRSFRTSGSTQTQSQPSVTTSNASNISQTSATLNGYVNPNGSTDTQRWFEWGTNSGSLSRSTNRINQGSSASNFNETISGLLVDTTYYFRAMAENSVGTAQGSILSFRTDSGQQQTSNKPAVSTFSASNVDEDSATLGGYVYTNGSTDTTRWFEWGTSSGNLNRSTNRIGQSSDGAFNENISGLTGGTTYYFRAAGENSAGTDYGSVRSFRTDAGQQQTSDLPDVTTSSATNIDENSATLNGYLDPNGTTDTDRWFEWGTSSGSLNRSTNRVGQSSSGNFNQTISGLSTNTTYYFRAAAKNSAGTEYGIVRSFRTDSSGQSSDLADVTTLSATNIDRDSARLNGRVDSSDSNTDCWFEWGTSSGSLNRTTSRINEGSSSSDFNDYLSGLNSDTTYYYRAVAETSGGTNYGAVRSFRTDYSDYYQPNYNQLPTVTTYSPTGVYQNTATFNGYVNPNSSSDTYRWFEYYASGTGALSTSRVYHGSGSSSFNQYVSNLQNNTTYFVRAAAQNSAGTVYGNYISFGTGSGSGTYYDDSNQQPLALTNSATSIFTTSAQLNGLALVGSTASTNVWFEWGTNSSSLNSQTSLASIGYAASSPFTASLVGLVPGTTYYFRAVAQNAYGTGRGVILSFRTSGSVAQPAAPSGTSGGSSLSLRKEVENLSFPNGTKTSVAAAAGNTVRFNITVTNTGNTELDNVTVTDEVSSFLDFESATDGGTWNEASERVTWRIDNLDSGEKRTVSVNAEAKELPNNVVAENTAEATTSGLRTRTSNAVIVLVNTQHVILSIANEDEVVSPGENIDYVVTYKNEGESEVRNLRLTIVLPNGIEFKSSDFDFSREENILWLDVPDLNAKETGEVTFRANVNGEFQEETSVTTNALIVYTDLLDNNQRGVNAFVINVVRSGIGSFAASIFGSLPGNLPFLLLVLFVFIIAIYLFRRLRKVEEQTIPA